MDFELTPEQTVLKSTLSQFLAQRYDFATRTKASRSQPGYREDIWRGFADTLGLLGLCLPESEGGPVEQLIVMEEAGRALVLEPLAETLFQAGLILRRCQATMMLEQIAGGKAIVGLGINEPDMRHYLEDIALTAQRNGTGWRLTGQKAVVMTAPWATHLIIAARTKGDRGEAQGLSLFLVPVGTPGLTLSCFPTLDGRQAADLTLGEVQVGPETMLGEEGTALPLLEEVRDHAIAAQAAEASGLLARLVQDTVDYAKQRKQFGQPIAAFQALQHRMVDMHMHVDLTRSAALFASLKLSSDPKERALAASAAKVTLANACRFVGQNAVQLHGGMGMTDELPIGHYFKRATVLENEFGSAAWHLARHARLSRTYS